MTSAGDIIYASPVLIAFSAASVVGDEWREFSAAPPACVLHGLAFVRFNDLGGRPLRTSGDLRSFCPLDDSVRGCARLGDGRTLYFDGGLNNFSYIFGAFFLTFPIIV